MKEANKSPDDQKKGIAELEALVPEIEEKRREEKSLSPRKARLVFDASAKDNEKIVSNIIICSFDLLLLPTYK